MESHLNEILENPQTIKEPSYTQRAIFYVEFDPQYYSLEQLQDKLGENCTEVKLLKSSMVEDK